MIAFTHYTDKTKEDLDNLFLILEKMMAQYCPEWHIVKHNAPIGIIYHIYRHDFSARDHNKGTDKEWPVEISQVPFAIERTDGTVQIANELPIRVK